MYTYLHNPRCSKSRDWLALIKTLWRKYELGAYIKNPLDYNDLLALRNKLWLRAIEFTRTWEKEFTQAWLNKDSSDEQILKAMAKFPKLMERPIVYNESKGVIWRWEGKILDFINGNYNE